MTLDHVSKSTRKNLLFQTRKLGLGCVCGNLNLSYPKKWSPELGLQVSSDKPPELLGQSRTMGVETAFSCVASPAAHGALTFADLNPSRLSSQICALRFFQPVISSSTVQGRGTSFAVAEKLI